MGTKFILAANPALGVKNLKEFVAYARARPGKITYANLGPGSSHFLAGELLAALRDPEAVEKITRSGVDPVGTSPEQFGTLMKNDKAKWAGVVKQAGIKPQ